MTWFDEIQEGIPVSLESESDQLHLFVFHDRSPMFQVFSQFGSMPARPGIIAAPLLVPGLRHYDLAIVPVYLPGNVAKVVLDREMASV